ncbi:hypothetical protein GH810_09510 [Acetobacterium paludosum]|uniref:Uncharacterized protein n=1 Tax=Acetobacterium paludosum TaxID=52693 RepID=A0A923KWW6_9FIRM|nr:hypothetical protein [Acetobacterium paludosum]MBC3888543.1 hypothetical protein [Acetobacterium paludosum]
MPLTFYGERGLVTSIILDMGTDIAKQKKFLKTIKFSDNYEPTWISDTVKIDFIVEPSLSQFGSPNLIIIAEEKFLQRHVIFVEARICAYNDASEKLNVSLLPNSYKGVSNKLNIKLALMYRFAKAYNSMKEDSVIESANTASKVYHDVPRTLKKPSMIKLCIENFGYNPDFLFVALTNDPMDVIPFKNKKFLPAIGVTSWHTERKSFGLISYAMLDDNNIIERTHGYYPIAKRNFLHLPAEIGTNDNDPSVKTIVMDQWNPILKLNLEEFILSLSDKLTTGKIIIFNGSYSVKSADGRTLVKLFADKDKMYIALRNDNIPEHFEDEPKIKIGVGPNAKSFVLIYSGTDDLTDDQPNKLRDDLTRIIIDFVER